MPDGGCWPPFYLIVWLAVNFAKGKIPERNTFSQLQLTFFNPWRYPTEMTFSTVTFSFTFPPEPRYKHKATWIQGPDFVQSKGGIRERHLSHQGMFCFDENERSCSIQVLKGLAGTVRRLLWNGWENHEAINAVRNGFRTALKQSRMH